MSDLDALLAGIVADPHKGLRWLVLADYLQDHDQPERAELVQLHRELLRTCCEPDQHPERAAWQARIVELIDQGVKPCVPQETLMLPGGVPLLANFIPPGAYLMGGSEEDAENPIHKVTLTRGFFVGVSPVTQTQWTVVMGDNVSRFKGDTLPVDTVSWEGATAFCLKVSELAGRVVRLPTEAEWEYACRAGTTTHFHWGDVPDPKRMNYDASLTWNGSAVGEYRKRTTSLETFAVNPWGLCDCHGNLRQFCRDWYDAGYYWRSRGDNPECQDGEQMYRVLRGGSWFNDPRNCRAASRDSDVPEFRGYNSGFRVVRCLD